MSGKSHITSHKSQVMSYKSQVKNVGYGSMDIPIHNTAPTASKMVKMSDGKSG